MTTLNPKPEPKPAKRGQTGLLNKAWFVVLVPSIFLLVLVVRQPAIWFTVSPLRAYKSPSDSMCPAICEGDRFLAAMDAYRKSDPKRGDIVLFEFRPGTLFTKRVAGIPGDLVSAGPRGEIVVNGQSLTWARPCGNSSDIPRVAGSEPIYFASVRVSEGSFFVVGDNLPNSYDSRFAEFGLVRRDQLRAKPVFFYWSTHFSRIGCEVH